MTVPLSFFLSEEQEWHSEKNSSGIWDQEKRTLLPAIHTQSVKFMAWKDSVEISCPFFKLSSVFWDPYNNFLLFDINLTGNQKSHTKMSRYRMFQDIFPLQLKGLVFGRNNTNCEGKFFLFPGKPSHTIFDDGLIFPHFTTRKKKKERENLEILN